MVKRTPIFLRDILQGNRPTYITRKFKFLVSKVIQLLKAYIPLV